MEKKSEREKDLEALKVLLGHWVQHNQTHTTGYVEWEKKCEQHGLDEVAAELKKAIDYFAQAGQALVAAQRNFAKLNIDD